MPDLTDIKELDTQAVQVIKQAHLGPAMKKLTMQRTSAYIDLMNSGRCRAATVINFNPVSLKVEDGNVPWRIPAATDKLKKSVEIEHGGRKYQAACFTIPKENARFVPWIRDVHRPSEDGENASAEYDAKFILPIEMIDQYKIQYSSPQFTPMGGVLAFEGDLHSFLKKETLRVPRSSRLPDGTRSYFCEEIDLATELASVLAMQKEYGTGMIQQGDEYFQDDDNRKNITPIHRIWAQFFIDMGWKQIAPLWMSANLEGEEVCKGCGKGKTRGDAWACTCGRYYNPLAAFLAGENVPESYIFSLKGKDLDQALAEMDRRQKIRARIAGSSTTPPAK